MAALIGITAVALINNVFRHPELMVPVLMLISLIVVRPAMNAAAGRSRGGCEVVSAPPAVRTRPMDEDIETYDLGGIWAGLSDAGRRSSG